MAIPGRRSLAFASGWFDAPTVSRVFEPLIADWQREWTDAPQSRRPWISIRGTIALTMTVVALTPRAILMTPAPPVLIRRTLMRITIFTAAASLAMLAPWLYELRGMPLGRLAIGALFLLPSIVALIFPFAMPWVADGLRQQSTPTPAERMAAVRVGLTAMTFALGIIGFAMPIANQQYRELVAPDAVKRPVPRGVRELTLTELIASPPPPHFGGHTPHVAAAELNKRLSITLLPAVLLWLRWGAHNKPRRRWWSPLPVAAETALAYVTFYSLASSNAGWWVMLAALVAFGAVRAALSRTLSAAPA
jgi:hypothetical protein